jgi:hypothetical protein
MPTTLYSFFIHHLTLAAPNEFQREGMVISISGGGSATAEVADHHVVTIGLVSPTMELNSHEKRTAVFKASEHLRPVTLQPQPL